MRQWGIRGRGVKSQSLQNAAVFSWGRLDHRRVWRFNFTEQRKKKKGRSDQSDADGLFQGARFLRHSLKFAGSFLRRAPVSLRNTQLSQGYVLGSRISLRTQVSLEGNG